jgi:hypothetical protein
MNMKKLDEKGIQPMFAVIAVVLVTAFILIVAAMVVTAENDAMGPPDTPSNDPIGYLTPALTVTASPGVTSTAITYAMNLGVGSHEGDAPQAYFFFMLPESLTAMYMDYAVTFDVVYPDGQTVSDTVIWDADSGAWTHTFECSQVLVYENGAYMVTAYFFVDGEQYGDAVTQGVNLNGDWDY